MTTHVLKKIRVIVSLIFFLLISFIFVDFTSSLTEGMIRGVLYLQFIPSLIKFINLLSISIIGFFIILVLTALFGRVYCSSICPLGTLQDVINYLHRKLFFKKKKKKFSYLKPLTLLRYALMGLTILVFLSGSIFVVNLLDPYSNFGRILGSLFRPVYLFLNNLLVHVFEAFDSYAVYPVKIEGINIISVIFSFVFFVGLLLFVVKRGRLYCNAVCPVGTLLGLISKISVYKIKIIDNICTSCGNCEKVCKAGCINLEEKKVDMSRCINCFNCLSVCTFKAIEYSRLPSEKTAGIKRESKKEGRRNFFKKGFSTLAGLSILSNTKLFAQKNDLIPIKREFTVSPPGSQSLDHFVNACTACHLCISVCPTHVLQPSIMEYGLEGILQPYMDYSSSFCNYECKKCGDVCPSGAILPMTLEDKKLTQIGKVKFIKENCVVYTDETACGACAEHCPTKAVRMVPYKGKLTIPETTDDICIGCGACEYACPVIPHKAIYVEGNPIHQVAKMPKQEEQQEVDMEEDFPF